MSLERLTVVIAAFNEADTLPALHPRLQALHKEMSEEMAREDKRTPKFSGK